MITTPLIIIVPKREIEVEVPSRAACHRDMQKNCTALQWCRDGAMQEVTVALHRSSLLCTATHTVHYCAGSGSHSDLFEGWVSSKDGGEISGLAKSWVDQDGETIVLPLSTLPLTTLWSHVQFTRDDSVVETYWWKWVRSVLKPQRYASSKLQLLSVNQSSTG